MASALVELGGLDEDVAIAALLSLDASYGDNLSYSVFSDGSGYNSNSYVAGILNALGLTPPDIDANTPGYSRLVPAASFEAAVKVIAEIQRVAEQIAAERQLDEWVRSTMDFRRMTGTDYISEGRGIMDGPSGGRFCSASQFNCSAYY